MKEAIIIISVLVLVFVPGFLFTIFLDNTGSELLDILEDMKKDFEASGEIFIEKSKKLNECFLKNECKWIMVVDHEALDEIEDNLRECVGFYKEGNQTEFEIAAEKLKGHIEDLKKREDISIGNIF